MKKLYRPKDFAKTAKMERVLWMRQARIQKEQGHLKSSIQYCVDQARQHHSFVMQAILEEKR